MKVRYKDVEYPLWDFFMFWGEKEEGKIRDAEPKKQVTTSYLTFYIIDKLLAYYRRTHDPLMCMRFLAPFLDERLRQEIEFIPETPKEKRDLFRTQAFAIHLTDQRIAAKRDGKIKELEEKIRKEYMERLKRLRGRKKPFKK